MALNFGTSTDDKIITEWEVVLNDDKLDEFEKTLNKTIKTEKLQAKTIKEMERRGVELSSTMQALKNNLQGAGYSFKKTQKAIDDTTKSIQKMQQASQKTSTGGGLASFLGGAAGSAVGIVASKGISALTNNIGELIDESQRYNAVAKNFKGDIDALREASLGLSSAYELVQSRQRLNILGVKVSEKQFEDMTKDTTRLARALGIDVGYAMESLSVGLSRQSKLFLDNLGIVISVDEANQKFAASIGKTVDELTDQERQAAFNNETLTQLKAKATEVGDANLTLTEQLKTGWVRTRDALVKAFGDIDRAFGRMFSGDGEVVKAAVDMEERLRTALQEASSSAYLAAAEGNEVLSMQLKKRAIEINKALQIEAEKNRKLRATQNIELAKAMEAQLLASGAKADKNQSIVEQYNKAYMERAKLLEQVRLGIKGAAEAARKSETEFATLKEKYDAIEDQRESKRHQERLKREREALQAAKAAAKERDQINKKIQDDYMKRLADFFKYKASLDKMHYEASQAALGPAANEAAFTGALPSMRKQAAGFESPDIPGIASDIENQKIQTRIQLLNMLGYSLADIEKGYLSVGDALKIANMADQNAAFIQSASWMKAQGKQILNDFSGAIWNMADAAVNSGESFGTMMKAYVKQTLLGIASTAQVRAIEQLALALGAQGLTWGAPNSSSVNHWASFAAFQSIAGLTGLGGIMMGGTGVKSAGGGGVKPSQSGGAYRSGRDTEGETRVSNIYSEGRNLIERPETWAPDQTPEINVTVNFTPIPGDEAANEFARRKMLQKTQTQVRR